MNLHSELKKVGVSHNCSQCCRSCCGRKEACREFYPSNMSAFMAYIVESLRDIVPQSKDSKLKRHVTSDCKCFDDGVTTLDAYYVQLINSVLSEIRKGKADYVFNFEQIKDIMRVEPRITVRYIAYAECYEIRKAK